MSVSDDAAAFGRSLHADFYMVTAATCEDIVFCYDLLDDIVERLRVTKQAPPFVFRSPAEQFPDKAGISGWVPLIESGVSIHTLTVKRFVSIDIYTCGQLDVSDTLDYLRAKLGTAQCEHHHLIRGKAYYK